MKRERERLFFSPFRESVNVILATGGTPYFYFYFVSFVGFFFLSFFLSESSVYRLGLVWLCYFFRGIVGGNGGRTGGFSFFLPFFFLFVQEALTK